MPEHRLYDDYTDLSSEAGFQFEFYCERCGDAWRSPFRRYTPGRFPIAMDAASRALAPLRRGSQGLAAHRSADWDRAREAVFRQAAHSASSHFHHCAGCASCCCPRCWDLRTRACLRCAPERDGSEVLDSAANVVSVITAQPVVEGPENGATSGRRCAVCGRGAGSAAFCPHCGAGLGPRTACRGCRTPVPAAARFCPHCGQKQRR